MLCFSFLLQFAFLIDFSREEGAQNMEIENQLHMTVIFPDASLPEPTNGGFANQLEFRQFVQSNNKRCIDSEVHSRPLNERLQDYKDETIADAFPLLFPYGYTGFLTDPAVKMLQNRTGARHISRQRLVVLRKYLQHRNPAFHGAMFNLIVENLIMKETIFLQAKIQCNVKQSENLSMGNIYGAMSSVDLEKAISNVRNHLPAQHSKSGANQFLKSIRASCTHLPHSNEATMEARRTLFSYIIKFGLPCLFLTVSPDDLRNFRIVVYSNKNGVVSGMENVTDLSDAEILADFQIRAEARVNHPGLCAEEYERIVHLVIKHLFNWDMEKQQSNGIGLFAEILAFVLATEEQVRKSLHGHFLIFVKCWQQILNILQRRKLNDPGNEISFRLAKLQTKAFYTNACSAQLFADFAPGEPLSSQPVFFHKNCRSDRSGEMRFSVKPVTDQQFREMRHKQLCHSHHGVIATCEKCNHEFSVQDIVSLALLTHNRVPGFPDGTVRHLDKHVYELQKDFSWMTKSRRWQAKRYLACNSLVNMHLVNHTSRCFKKGPDCYANLPEPVSEQVNIFYSPTADMWSNWLGIKSERYMFRIQPKRCVEDAFMNTHNPAITSLLGCNSNVLVGMNGRSVIYVTSYNAKSQQKEERVAFETLCQAMIPIVKNQVSDFFHHCSQY